jgi:hypothetical protein
MTSAAMGPSNNGLVFSFADMYTEIESLRNGAHAFLDARSHSGVLLGWKNNLNGYQSNQGKGKWTWEISESTPVTTIPTNQYLRNGEGPYKVYGTISAVWEIQKVQPPSKKKTAPSQFFSVIGLASTKVRILQHETGKELARWRFEIGDASSPGCHFHVQVMGAPDDALFPKQLRVPRLPGVLITPMDAMEFLLGELFQDHWKQEVYKQNKYITDWAGHQRKRLTRLLGWQRKEIENSKGQGTPWNWLKHQKPPANVLIHD